MTVWYDQIYTLSWQYVYSPYDNCDYILLQYNIFNYYGCEEVAVAVIMIFPVTLLILITPSTVTSVSVLSSLLCITQVTKSKV